MGRPKESTERPAENNEVGDRAVMCSQINLKSCRKDKRGASLVEYSLLLGLVSLAAVLTIATVGGDVTTIWETTATGTGTASGRL